MNRTHGTVLLALGLFFIAACGVQKPGPSAVQVPDAVQQTYHLKFPAVANPEWSLKADHNYEAEFTAQQVDMAVKFDPAGNWLETETTIPQAAVPKEAQAAVDAQFKDYKIIEAQILRRAGTDDLTYEIHLDNGKEIVKAEVSPQGAILAQSATPKP